MHPWDVTGIGQWALAGSRLSSKAQLGEKSVSQQMAWLEARRLSLARVACHACLSSLTDANNSYLECRGLIGSLSIFNALILWSIKSGLTFEGRASRPSRKNNQDWQCNSKGSTGFERTGSTEVPERGKMLVSLKTDEFCIFVAPLIQKNTWPYW